MRVEEAVATRIGSLRYSTGGSGASSMFKPYKLLLLAILILFFLFLFTRPSDYRNLQRDIAGTLEDQWCAWSEVVGNECVDRSVDLHCGDRGCTVPQRQQDLAQLDEARQFGEELGSKIPVTAPSEGSGGKQD